MTTHTRPSILPDEPDWDALARHLADESPAGEDERVHDWLAADPAHAELASTLRRSMDRLADTPPADLDVEGALRRVHDRMHQDETRVIPLRRAAPWWAGAPLRAAAAVLLVLAAGLLWARLRGSDPEAARSYAAAVGQRQEVRLPDGTRVLLGPGSELRLAAGYGSGKREVELRGAALFEVVHDASRPFAVRSGAAEIQDVGTRFTVRDGAAGEVRVLVTEGAVELKGKAGAGGDGVMLHAGERGILHPGTRAVAERAGGTESDLGWTEGRLVFAEAPLTEVGVELHRWYGVELRVADGSLARRRLTASFAGDPADRALRVIALAVGARLEMRGDTAILHDAARAGGR
jgi:transmembrane sensor